MSGTLTVTSVKTTSITATLVTSTSATGAAITGSDYAGTNRTAANAVAIPATATSATFEFGIGAATASATSFIQVEDIKGTITGAPGTSNSLYFDKAMTNGSAGDSTEVTASLTFRNAPLAALANAFTIQDVNGATLGSNTETISFVASATTLGSLTVSPDALRMATGGAATFTATYEDQFAVAKANITVTVTVSGRNSAKAASTLITDADGRVSYSFTDTGTTGTADVITLTAGGTSIDYVNITYGTAVAGSVMVDTPSTDGFTATTAGLDTYPMAYSYIDASSDAGAETGAVAISALVKDADGNVMAAMPVTWSVSGTGCAIPTNMVTSYTNSSGVAASSVYAWLQGACVVTATSGGKSDTANSYWVQDGPTEARKISATVDGNSIVALVQDRFGNPISSVDVKVTRVSGTGTFGAASSATAQTGTDGKVTFVVTGGSVTATVGFTNSTYGQSDAAAGLIDGTSTAAANTFDATVAGTALDAESGVGATLSAAGVNSVSVSVELADTAQAAADAAAEATDAANAATDAANAAAEAADAATAAAQDAADAVAALSAQVATLISGLKAQLTALTNLVIKIQKKVKA
jgi:5-hydroxyisourate hydrolase-like protein (transthyretin family)